MGKSAWKTTDNMWETPVTREVLRAYGIQTSATYICCSQGRVSQWVSLCMIYEVCAWYHGFEGGGGAEETVVVTIGSEGDSQQHAGRGLALSASKSEMKGPLQRDREQ